MTRRGVIAALATVPAYCVTPKIRVGTSAPVSLLDLNMDKMADGDWALTVNYKGESVKISAREIMDALLPVRPNHCPACGFDCGPAPKLEPYEPIDPGFYVYPDFPWDNARQKRNAEKIAADKAQPHGIASECPRCRCMFGRD